MSLAVLLLSVHIFILVLICVVFFFHTSFFIYIYLLLRIFGTDIHLGTRISQLEGGMSLRARENEGVERVRCFFKIGQ